MNSNILSLVGLAKKAGRLEAGEEPVGAAARARQARLILVAADAADNTFRRARHFAEAGAVPWTAVPFTKTELGGIVGRSSCAMAAFTDTGFAASMAAKLAALDPERYGELAAQLDKKAQKALQRQKEQRRHEKNLRQGRHKPWAPPADNAGAARRRIAEKQGTAAKQAPRPKAHNQKSAPPKGGALKIQGRPRPSRGPKKAP